MNENFFPKDGGVTIDVPWNRLPEPMDGTYDIKRLDVSIVLTQETRWELPPLSEETADRLKDSGWPSEVIRDIGSEAEAGIYEGAELEPKEVNGKPALVRTDIDPTQKDAMDMTNLERMQSGRAPLDENGKPIELHHIGQRQDSCLAELTLSEHRGAGNDNVLHNKLQESTIDREGFAAERSQHWKARAADFKVGE
jgi:hypothetical protein